MLEKAEIFDPPSITDLGQQLIENWKKPKKPTAVSYLVQRHYLKSTMYVSWTARGRLETVHFRHECLQKVNRFLRSGQLSDILFQWIWAEPHGDSHSDSSGCAMLKISLVQWETKNLYRFLSKQRSKARERPAEWSCGDTHTRVHTVISLTSH